MNGKSSLEIAEMLTRREIPSIDGNAAWNDSTIRYILSNEKYIGDCLCQKNYTTETLPFLIHKNKGSHPQYYIENSHPAIIDRRAYDRAQNLLTHRTYEKKESHINSPFHKKVFCGNCGSAMIRKVSKKGVACYVCQ